MTNDEFNARLSKLEKDLEEVRDQRIAVLSSVAGLMIVLVKLKVITARDGDEALRAAEWLAEQMREAMAAGIEPENFLVPERRKRRTTRRR